eukprot:CFRG6803T1
MRGAGDRGPAANDSGQYSLLYPSSKKVFFMKMPDNVLDTILDNVGCPMTLTLPVLGNRTGKGTMTLTPQDGGDPINFQFQEKEIPAKISADTAVLRDGADYFECIGNATSRFTFPSVLTKNLADKTRMRSMAAEQEKNDKVTQVIDRNAPKEKQSYGFNANIGITTKARVPHRATGNRTGPGKSNLSSGNIARTGTSPMGTDQPSAPPQTSKQAQDFRERVLHLLALMPMRRSDLETRLRIQQGDTALTSLLRSIATHSGMGEYELKDSFYAEVQVHTWRTFTQSQHATVLEKAKAAFKRLGWTQAEIDKKMSPPSPHKDDGSPKIDSERQVSGTVKRKVGALSPHNVPKPSKNTASFLTKKRNKESKNKKNTPIKVPASTLKSPNPAARRSPVKSPMRSKRTTMSSPIKVTSHSLPSAPKLSPKPEPDRISVLPYNPSKSTTSTVNSSSPYSSTSFNKQSRVAYEGVNASSTSTSVMGGMAGGKSAPSPKDRLSPSVPRKGGSPGGVKEKNTVHGGPTAPTGCANGRYGGGGGKGGNQATKNWDPHSVSSSIHEQPQYRSHHIQNQQRVGQHSSNIDYKGKSSSGGNHGNHRRGDESNMEDHRREEQQRKLDDRYKHISSQEMYDSYLQSFEVKHKRYMEILDLKKQTEAMFKKLYDRKTQLEHKYGPDSHNVRSVDEEIVAAYKPIKQELSSRDAEHAALSLELKHIKKRLQSYS